MHAARHLTERVESFQWRHVAQESGQTPPAAGPRGPHRIEYAAVPDEIEHRIEWLAMRELIVQGMAWGHMPLHLVSDDLAAGRLRSLESEQLPATSWEHLLDATENLTSP